MALSRAEIENLVDIDEEGEDNLVVGGLERTYKGDKPAYMQSSHHKDRPAHNKARQQGGDYSALETQKR